MVSSFIKVAMSMIRKAIKLFPIIKPIEKKSKNRFLIVFRMRFYWGSWNTSHDPLEYKSIVGNAYCIPTALPYSYCKIWQSASVELHSIK